MYDMKIILTGNQDTIANSISNYAEVQDITKITSLLISGVYDHNIHKIEDLRTIPSNITKLCFGIQVIQNINIKDFYTLLFQSIAGTNVTSFSIILINHVHNAFIDACLTLNGLAHKISSLTCAMKHNNATEMGRLITNLDERITYLKIWFTEHISREDAAKNIMIPAFRNTQLKWFDLSVKYHVYTDLSEDTETQLRQAISSNISMTNVSTHNIDLLLGIAQNKTINLLHILNNISNIPENHPIWQELVDNKSISVYACNIPNTPLTAADIIILNKLFYIMWNKPSIEQIYAAPFANDRTPLVPDTNNTGIFNFNYKFTTYQQKEEYNKFVKQYPNIVYANNEILDEKNQALTLYRSKIYPAALLYQQRYMLEFKLYSRVYSLAQLESLQLHYSVIYWGLEKKIAELNKRLREDHKSNGPAPVFDKARLRVLARDTLIDRMCKQIAKHYELCDTFRSAFSHFTLEESITFLKKNGNQVTSLTTNLEEQKKEIALIDFNHNPQARFTQIMSLCKLSVISIFLFSLPFEFMLLSGASLLTSIGFGLMVFAMPLFIDRKGYSNLVKTSALDVYELLFTKQPQAEPQRA